MRWIFDIEVYPNLFLLCAKNAITKEFERFQVSQLADNRNEMLLWLQNNVTEMVGFNNLYYDYPVLHNCLLNLWQLKGSDFCKKTFDFSTSIIKGKINYLKEKDHLIKQIDLFKINHYDNKARIVSLKLLQFNFAMPNIQELPYKPGTVLTLQEIQNVIDYCDNDVNATEILYKNTLSEIILREKMSPIYGIDFTNYNSTKMGEYILISKIIESLGRDAVYDSVETDYGIKEIAKQTINKEIDLSKVVFDYISFTTKPFQNILKWFKSKIITETNGVFSEIPFNELLLLENNYVVKKKNGKQETLNVLYKDFQYDFGVGGLHGSIKSGIYQADDNYDIYDFDVTSFYPKLAIVNKFYPMHYGQVFCDVYEGLFLEREQYDKKTHYAENLAIKLALNGSYGFGI
jgi:hypothetical protein